MYVLDTILSGLLALTHLFIFYSISKEREYYYFCWVKNRWVTGAGTSGQG